jgi:glutamate dehydrogenase/leucine dehydrogenase
MKGKTVVVQGFGNVGSYASKFFHEAGAKVIGIVEYDCALTNPSGIDIAALFAWVRVGSAALSSCAAGAVVEVASVFRGVVRKRTRARLLVSRVRSPCLLPERRR